MRLKHFSLLGLWTLKWKVEPDIPDDCILFKHIHFDKVTKDLLPSPSSFADFELSCDWNKYATAQSCRELLGRQYRTGKTEFKNPSNFFICGMLGKDILAQDIEQTIKHNPLQTIPEVIGAPNNRAHTLVIGDKEDLKRRLLLSLSAQWHIFDKSEYENLIASRKKNKM